MLTTHYELFTYDYSTTHYSLLYRCVTVPILAAQLLLLTGIIVMLYIAWLKISASQHNRAVKTMLVVLLSVLWSVLVSSK